MIQGRYRSLQFRLVIRLTILYVAATVIILGVLMYRAYETTGTLNNRELSLRATDLAQAVSVDPGGIAHLRLPDELKAAYDAAPGVDIYVIRGRGNQVIAASPRAFGALVKAWPAATDDPDFFDLQDPSIGAEDYFGLSIRQSSAAGPLSISVARGANADALIHSILQDFVLDIAWIIPVLVAVTLAIGILAIRSVLRPIREISDMAAAIGPNATNIRLSDEKLPNEIAPLVAAMNRALDRLQQGFVVQRQFTANAAHELRTPLAIITAALDTMEGNDELNKLKADVARMNRLVEQLLGVARLDAIALDVSSVVDLNVAVAGVVESMAAWALNHSITIAFNGCDPAVTVKGNKHAIADAIRNLVENAVVHSPAGGEVTVSTRHDGSVSVADQGSGVPINDRQSIFRRFWRGKNAASQGAGLGLAIVSEIMKVHHGRVAVESGPRGGAIFTLWFALPE